MASSVIPTVKLLDMQDQVESLLCTWSSGLRKRREDKVREDLMMRHRSEKPDTRSKDKNNSSSSSSSSNGNTKNNNIPILTRMVFHRRDAPIWSLYACVVCLDLNRLCNEHEFVLDGEQGVNGYVSHVVSEGWYNEPPKPADHIPSSRSRSRMPRERI
jgi:hypothetical protein